MTRRGRPWLWLAACAALSLLGLWLTQRAAQRDRPPRTPQVEGASTPQRPSAPGLSRTSSAATSPPQRRASSEADCVPRAEIACAGGDVRYIDSCGRPGQRVQECGAVLCRDGACQATDPAACQGLSPQGQCDGDVVRGCIAGRPFERDCGARGMRCVHTDEGAECRTPSRRDCDPADGFPRCIGDALLSCIDGRLHLRDCADYGGKCLANAPDTAPHCIVLQSRDAPPPPSECGPCGCPEDYGAGEERCDGEDQDADGVVDEGAACDPIPVVAFIVTDEAGRGSYVEADIEAELQRVNAVLGSAPPGLQLSVVLQQVRTLPRPEWLDLQDDALMALFTEVSPMPAPSGPPVASGAVDATSTDGFFVPIVFTDSLERGETPKVGLSTLPNGHCGGRRVSDHPEANVGGIAVAKGRSPTTVAHELGHYFGLCHTHFEGPPAVREAITYADAGRTVVQRCQADCEEGGDGICDTPPDPGPETCALSPACAAVCTDGAAPHADNVMSYYSPCRSRISVEQARVMRRGLAWRRGFARCRRPSDCPCDPLTPQCPQQMTCRPTREGFGCGLDGPLPAGAACRGHLDCGGGTLCGSDGRCHTPCHPAWGRCACIVDPALPVRICEAG